MADRTGKRLQARDRAHGETKNGRGHDRAEAIRAIQQGHPMLYALRLSDGAIKIGCSRDIANRRRQFRGSEVLGVRFGEEDEEQAIHATLVPHRARAWEYYHPTPAVMAVVNQMRDEFGLPHIAA